MKPVSTIPYQEGVQLLLIHNWKELQPVWVKRQSVPLEIMDYMVALGMLSTALKDLAVEMKIFVMSSTQTNAKSEDEQKGLKNESVIRGSRAIIDKCDIACVASRVTSDEIELLKDTIEKIGVIPNQVLDIYKVRRGKYTNVRIWSSVDLGTCRKRDLFITNDKLQLIDGFETISFSFKEEDNSYLSFMKQLNEDIQENPTIINTESVKQKEEKIEVLNIENNKNKSKSLYEGLL